jgi:hypothetical protein
MKEVAKLTVAMPASAGFFLLGLFFYFRNVG